MVNLGLIISVSVEFISKELLIFDEDCINLKNNPKNTRIKKIKVTTRTAFLLSESK